MNLRYGIRYAALATALLSLLAIVFALVTGNDDAAGSVAVTFILAVGVAGLTIEREY